MTCPRLEGTVNASVEVVVAVVCGPIPPVASVRVWDVLLLYVTMPDERIGAPTRRRRSAVTRVVRKRVLMPLNSEKPANDYRERRERKSDPKRRPAGT